VTKKFVLVQLPSTSDGEACIIFYLHMWRGVNYICCIFPRQRPNVVPILRMHPSLCEGQVQHIRESWPCGGGNESYVYDDTRSWDTSLVNHARGELLRVRLIPPMFPACRKASRF
jgi:hypothetical protein